MDIAPLTYLMVGTRIFPATVHKEDLPCNITDALYKAGSMAFAAAISGEQYIPNSRARQVGAPVIARTNVKVVAGIDIIHPSMVYVDANNWRVSPLMLLYIHR